MRGKRTDIKGNLYKLHCRLLKKLGYRIVVLNFNEPCKGDAYNPFKAIYREGVEKMNTYIDTHTHMDHKRFDSNRKDIIEYARSSGIGAMVNPAISYESNHNMRKLLKKYDFIKYGVGIHPNSVGIDSALDEEWEKGLQDLLTLSDKNVAIGETGLDYHRYTRNQKGKLDDISFVTNIRQKEWFVLQLKLAARHKLPLILHIRSADETLVRMQYELDENTELSYVDAHRDAIAILKKYDSILPERKGVVHCFNTDKLSDANEYIKMGYYLGIGGTFTHPENSTLREILKEIPLQHIILETDSPFVLPADLPEDTAFYGKRNTPLNIPYIAECLAKLKGCSVDEVLAITTENAKRLFGL